MNDTIQLADDEALLETIANTVYQEGPVAVDLELIDDLDVSFVQLLERFSIANRGTYIVLSERPLQTDIVAQYNLTKPDTDE